MPRKRKKPAASSSPWFWLIAGINGAGKSTLVAKLRKQQIINATYYNPDEITKWVVRNKELGCFVHGIPNGETKELDLANKHAADIAMDVVRITLETTDGSLAIETVLSTDKYRQTVELAKQNQRKFGFVYIGLSSPEQAIERVAARVSRGGHGVPNDKIRKRWKGSLEQLPWFVAQSDLAFIYSNATNTPVQLAKGKRGKLKWMDKKALPHVTAALSRKSRIAVH